MECRNELRDGTHLRNRRQLRSKMVTYIDLGGAKTKLSNFWTSQYATLYCIYVRKVCGATSYNHALRVP